MIEKNEVAYNMMFLTRYLITNLLKNPLNIKQKDDQGFLL